MKKQEKTDKKMNEMLYGAHPLIEMLKAGKRKIVSLYMTKPYPKAWARVEPYLPKAIPNIQYVDRSVLDRMAGSMEHQGILAWVTPFKVHTGMFDPKKKPNILLLDSVQDVRNLGAILRSAYCTGVTGVVLCQRDAAGLTPAAFKASAGLAEHLDIYYASSMQQAVQEAKKAGYTLYLAVLDGGKNILETSFTQPACLVIGNEAVGIQTSIRKDGHLITLPQSRPDISYNASVAAGILLFLMVNKR